MPATLCTNSGSDHSKQRRIVAAGLLPSAVQQLFIGQPAIAAAPDAAAAPEAATSAANDAAAAATTMLEKDPVTTVLFTIAIGALSIVTLGAAYLAISGVLADRKEKKDREEFEASQASRQIADDRAKLQASRKVPRRKSSKGSQGFG